MTPERRRRPVAHDVRVRVLTLTAGLPALMIAMGLLWGDDHVARVRWTLSAAAIGCWLGFSFAAHERVVRPLQTLSNMLAALREGDYSIRARSANTEDPLGLALLEVNTLSETLRAQRLGALEASALLQRVMEEIDVATFAFDGERKLRLANRGGERLLGRNVEKLLGRDANALGLGACLEGETPRVIEIAHLGGAGRWELRRSEFRQGGRPHQLIVLSDLSRALREEERQAWQRLIRVLSHEINNSLAPIKSIAGSLQSALAGAERRAGFETDLSQGLGVIATRADSLSRFMSAYARLARLPKPKLAPLDVGAWVQRVAGLETRIAVEVVPGPAATLSADGDQCDQLLINLVRNAADAALETGGGARVSWRADGEALELSVEDDGPGLADTHNLFVPFFTTKPSGSGIGLALSRQIAEAHGGVLTLENRVGARGCVARLRLSRVRVARDR